MAATATAAWKRRRNAKNQPAEDCADDGVMQMNILTFTKHLHLWMSDRENNAIEPGASSPAFELPLVGAARGDDPLFTFLKNDIGPDFYWTPVEAFTRAFPGITCGAEDLTVISWILPQTAATRAAHGKVSRLPAIEWSLARHYGEKVNEALRRHAASFFIKDGIRAFAPALQEQWGRHISAKYGFASSWSERHTAHVCGLGTFGISDGLITEAGKAVRIGSIIVNARLAPTPRKYSSHTQWCLHAAGAKCLVCAQRCPAGAISAAGHDKEKCKKYIREVTAVHVEREQLGFPVNSCGLCQTRVPCEKGIPAKLLRPDIQAIPG